MRATARETLNLDWIGVGAESTNARTMAQDRPETEAKQKMLRINHHVTISIATSTITLAKISLNDIC